MGPDYCYFKVKGEDGNLYILRMDMGRAEWELTDNVISIRRLLDETTALSPFWIPRVRFMAEFIERECRPLAHRVKALPSPYRLIPTFTKLEPTRMTQRRPIGLHEGEDPSRGLWSVRTWNVCVIFAVSSWPRHLKDSSPHIKCRSTFATQTQCCGHGLDVLPAACF